jgi:hypothetical protein
MKKIMIGAVHNGRLENCLAQDDTVLLLPSTTSASMSLFEETFDMRDEVFELS